MIELFLKAMWVIELFSRETNMREIILAGGRRWTREPGRKVAATQEVARA